MCHVVAAVLDDCRALERTNVFDYSAMQLSEALAHRSCLGSLLAITQFSPGNVQVADNLRWSWCCGFYLDLAYPKR